MTVNRKEFLIGNNTQWLDNKIETNGTNYSVDYQPKPNLLNIQN